MVLALVIKFTQLIQSLGNRGALNGKPGKKIVLLINVFNYIENTHFLQLVYNNQMHIQKG